MPGNLSELSWDDLRLAPDVDTIFCACPPVEPRGIAFASDAADMTALLAIASTVTVESEHGKLALDEFVLTAAKPTTTANGTIVGTPPPTPSINMSSTCAAPPPPPPSC